MSSSILVRALASAISLTSALASSPGATASAAPFVENRGQWPAEARYVARDGSTDIYALDDGLAFDVHDASAALRVSFAVGPAVDLSGAEKVPARWSCFVGDPSTWRAGLRGFREIRYRAVGPEAELRLRCGDGELICEAFGGGNADPRQSWMRYEGDARVFDGPGGRRRIECGAAVLEELPLSADGRRWAIRWRESTAIPASGGRDDAQLLIWSTFLGGSNNDFSQGLVTDAAGNIVIAGYTRSYNFPTTPGAYDETQGGSYDVLVAKVEANGSELLWATLIGDAEEDRAFDLALDPQENVIVAGHTFSAAFPTTPGAFDRTLGGLRDAFVCKLSSGGDDLLWSTYFGGGGGERATLVRADALGRPVFTGDTGSGDFPATGNAFDSTLGGVQDAYLAALDADGVSLYHATLLGGATTEYGEALALTRAGGAIVTGATLSSDFPVTPGAWDGSFGGSEDAFVSNVDLASGELLASTYLGGSLADHGMGIAVDVGGRIHLTGGTHSSDFPTTVGAFDRTWNGSEDVFYACLDAAAESLLGATYLGGVNLDLGLALVLDGDARPILTGETYSGDFPLTADAFDLTHGGTWERDGFVTWIDPVGPSLVWSSFVGGGDYDSGWDLELAGSDELILTGPTRSLDFPVTAGAYDLTYNGGQEDAYICRLAPFASSAAEEPRATPGALRLAPNPFTASVALGFDLETAGEVRVLVLDAAGRIVGERLSSPLPAGRQRLSWTGGDLRGRPLPAGRYWLRVETPSGVMVGRAVRLR